MKRFLSPITGNGEEVESNDPGITLVISVSSGKVPVDPSFDFFSFGPDLNSLCDNEVTAGFNLDITVEREDGFDSTCFKGWAEGEKQGDQEKRS